VTWDQVALDKVKVSGDALVVHEMAEVVAPLTAVKLAKLGVRVRILTKWPMIGWETTVEVYLHWILTYLMKPTSSMTLVNVPKILRFEY
jgi:hypothetical protein